MDEAKRILKDAKRRFTTELNESAKDYRQQLIDQHTNVDWSLQESKRNLNTRITEFKNGWTKSVELLQTQATANIYNDGYKRIRSERVDYEGNKTGYGKKKSHSKKRTTSKKAVKKPTVKRSTSKKASKK